MLDTSHGRFSHTLDAIVQEIHDLSLIREKRHAEFVRRIDEIKKRQERITDVRVRRLSEDGISVDIQKIRRSVSDICLSHRERRKQDHMTDLISIKSDPNNRLKDKFNLKMELSFDCKKHDIKSNTESKATDYPQNIPEDTTYARSKSFHYHRAHVSFRDQARVYKENEDKELSEKVNFEKMSKRKDNALDISDNKEIPRSSKKSFRRLGIKVHTMVRLNSNRRYSMPSLAPLGATDSTDTVKTEPVVKDHAFEQLQRRASYINITPQGLPFRVNPPNTQTSFHTLPSSTIKRQLQKMHSCNFKAEELTLSDNGVVPLKSSKDKLANAVRKLGSLKNISNQF